MQKRNIDFVLPEISHTYLCIYIYFFIKVPHQFFTIFGTYLIIFSKHKKITIN